MHFSLCSPLKPKLEIPVIPIWIFGCNFLQCIFEDLVKQNLKNMNGFNHRNCHNNQEKKGPLEKVVMKSIKFLSAKSSPFKINEN